MRIERIKELAGKSVTTVKEEGVKELFVKGKRFIGQRINSSSKPCFKDVLFINGCNLPHPKRYRVDHQIEQLEANGLSADYVDYDKLNLDKIKYYRTFVFFRCPITDTIEKFIKIAHENNKVVFYDIDDLVIDRKYTDTVKYLKNLSEDELNLYNNGVDRMQQTLKLCDYAITTTEELSDALSHYVKEVYINRNVASEKMVEYSLNAVDKVVREKDKIVMGYLSGSITHNDDFQMILPVIKKAMKKHSNLYLKVVGYLDIPSELEEFKDRIIFSPFCSWVKLPDIIASLDINLAPLEDSIFNRAKSENKWVEAALCKVVTIASNVGAFKHEVNDGIDGILCTNNKEWNEKLEKIITDREYREKIASNAYNRVIKEKVTTYSGYGLAKYINSKLKKNICFVLPTTNLSGGINLIIKHCHILKKNGFDVFVVNMDNDGTDIVNSDGVVNVLCYNKTNLIGYIDTMVATLWSTLDFVKIYPNVKNRSYLVQGFETDFNKFGNTLRLKANATYNSIVPINYITISKWCQNWLKDNYEKNSKYAPNGIDINKFDYKERKFNGKIKILVEGNPTDFYKNVDESFKIVEKLDKNKFEINFLSYQGEPKSWYYVDNFFHKVPHDEVKKIYQNSDILIKSSILESFSYPPLEMMATGGLVVVAPNGGNIEYLKDGENCLFYELGNIDDAVAKINELVNDNKLREKIIKSGLDTAKKRDWEKLEDKILDLYK